LKQYDREEVHMPIERKSPTKARAEVTPVTQPILWPVPETLFLVSGAAEGGSSLNAFDNALLAARIGDLNLIRVTSIAPPGVRIIEPYRIPPGSLVPVVYSSRISHEAGESITCAIAVGLPKDGGSGLVMEYSGIGDAKLAAVMARGMVREGFARRRRELGEVIVVTAEHKVAKLGAVIAACVFGFAAAGKKRGS
jgi:arginine decarboxylase